MLIEESLMKKFLREVWAALMEPIKGSIIEILRNQKQGIIAFIP